MGILLNNIRCETSRHFRNQKREHLKDKIEPKRDEMTRGWRKVHNEVFHNLYSSLSITRMIKSRRMRWAWHVAQIGRRGTRIGYWWKSEKERDHWEEKHVRGWTILIWILETEWDGMDLIDLAQDRHQWRALVNAVMNLRVPQNSGKFLSGCTIGGFSRRAQFNEVS
jgi:hypothetical protein